jgi:hypothetical protein
MNNQGKRKKFVCHGSMSYQTKINNIGNVCGLKVSIKMQLLKQIMVIGT